MREQLKREDDRENDQVGDEYWEEDYLRGQATLAGVCHYVGVVTYRAGLYGGIGVFEVVKSTCDALVWSVLAGRALGAAAVAGLVHEDGTSCRARRDASSLVKEISTCAGIARYGRRAFKAI